MASIRTEFSGVRTKFSGIRTHQYCTCIPVKRALTAYSSHTVPSASSCTGKHQLYKASTGLGGIQHIWVPPFQEKRALLHILKHLFGCGASLRPQRSSRQPHHCMVRMPQPQREPSPQLGGRVRAIEEVYSIGSDQLLLPGTA